MVKSVRLFAAFCLLAAAFCLSCTPSGEDEAALFTSTQGSGVTADPNSAVPGYFSGVVPWELEGEGVVEVTVQSDSELAPGDGKMTLSLSKIPFTTTADHGTSRVSSTLADAGDYYTAKNVAASEVQGFTFTPGDGEPSYACFELDSPLSTPFTVGVAWYSLPENMNSYYIGIGDESMQAWHWYRGPDDGVLTFDPTEWRNPGEIGSEVYICVALESGKPADFWQIKWGVPEIRGTGLAADDPQAASIATKAASETAVGALPEIYSLKPYLPPVANQGSMGACTAFAVNDAAFNVLLNELYGDQGWDVSQSAFRTSPMWSYVKSGMAPYGSWDPLCGSAVGRYMSQAFNVLSGLGTATAETVPYEATSDCGTTFPAEADVQAPLLQIDDWYQLSSVGALGWIDGDDTNPIVWGIKEELADNNQPVVIAMYGLESGFLNYSGGVYHYGGTYGVNGGHAMCIIGYDDTQAAFEVRNSWGSYWGLSGYWWIGYDAVVDLVTESELRFSAYSMSASHNPAAAAYFLGEVPIYDETEPNDTALEADALLDFNFASYSARLGNPLDTNDWYSFSYEEGYTTEFTLGYTPGAVDLSLELYLEDGTLVATSHSGGGSENIAGFWSGTGTGNLRVVHHSGAGDYLLAGEKTMPPAPPYNVNASDGTSSEGVVVSWTPDGVYSFHVYRADSADGTYELLDSTYSFEYTDLTAEPLVDYWYRIVSVGDEASSLPSESDSGYRGIPAPTGLMASDGAFLDRIAISWDPLEGATSYDLQRSQLAEGPFDSLGIFTDPLAEDFSVEPNITYHYVVCGISADKRTANSVADAGFTTMDDLSPGDDAAEPGADDELEADDGSGGTSGEVEADDNSQTVQGGQAIPGGNVSGR